MCDESISVTSSNEKIEDLDEAERDDPSYLAAEREEILESAEQGILFRDLLKQLQIKG